MDLLLFYIIVFYSLYYFHLLLLKQFLLIFRLAFMVNYFFLFWKVLLYHLHMAVLLLLLYQRLLCHRYNFFLYLIIWDITTGKCIFNLCFCGRGIIWHSFAYFVKVRVEDRASKSCSFLRSVFLQIKLGLNLWRGLKLQSGRLVAVKRRVLKLGKTQDRTRVGTRRRSILGRGGKFCNQSWNVARGVKTVPLILILILTNIQTNVCAHHPQSLKGVFFFQKQWLHSVELKYWRQVGGVSDVMNMSLPFHVPALVRFSRHVKSLK